MEPAAELAPGTAIVPVVDMTRKRVWFLFQLAGLIKAEIKQLTGWSRGQIDAGLDRYDLRSFGAESYWATNAYLDREIARFLRLDPTRIPTLEQTIDLRHALQDRLRDALVRGPIDWAAIDALPDQPVARFRRTAPRATAASYAGLALENDLLTRP